MLVAYNALNVRPGVVDGAATYSLNVLRHLPAALDGATVLAYVQPGERRLDGIEGIEVREVAAARHPAGRIVAESVWLGRSLAAEGASVLVAPYESIPFRPPCPVVVVAQNLVYHCEGFDDYLGSSVAQRTLSRLQRLYYRRRMRGAYRRAAAIVAVSAETERVLVARSGLPSGRTTVVHEGSDSVLLPESSPVEQREPRILSVGTFAPYKNHGRAIELFTRLAGDRPELRLELVGSDWRGYRAVVERYAAASGVSNRIDFAASLAPNELARRYSSSTLLLHLSGCEAFGLPLVEAMRYGLPVVAADRSSLPEVAGGAALLVDPDDMPAATTAVAGLLADDVALAALAEFGRGRAAELSWSRSAVRIAELVLQRARAGVDAGRR